MKNDRRDLDKRYAVSKRYIFKRGLSTVVKKNFNRVLFCQQNVFINPLKIFIRPLNRDGKPRRMNAKGRGNEKKFCRRTSEENGSEARP